MLDLVFHEPLFPDRESNLENMSNAFSGTWASTKSYSTYSRSPTTRDKCLQTYFCHNNSVIPAKSYLDHYSVGLRQSCIIGFESQEWKKFFVKNDRDLRKRYFFFKNGPTPAPRPLFCLFSYFQTNITNFYNKYECKKMSIQYPALGFELTTF